MPTTPTTLTITTFTSNDSRCDAAEHALARIDELADAGSVVVAIDATTYRGLADAMDEPVCANHTATLSSLLLAQLDVASGSASSSFDGVESFGHRVRSDRKGTVWFMHSGGAALAAFDAKMMGFEGSMSPTDRERGVTTPIDLLLNAIGERYAPSHIVALVEGLATPTGRYLAMCSDAVVYVNRRRFMENKFRCRHTDLCYEHPGADCEAPAHFVYVDDDQCSDATSQCTQ